MSSLHHYTLLHHYDDENLKLQIKNSTIENAGKGLFAYGNPNEIIFKKNSKICDYNGQLINEETLNERYGDGDQYTAPYAIRLHNNKYEDAATVRGIGSTANHSNNRNKINARLSIKRDNTAQLMSIKNIKGGQEIFIDYGVEYLFQDEDDNVCISTNRNKYKCETTRRGGDFKNKKIKAKGGSMKTMKQLMDSFEIDDKLN